MEVFYEVWRIEDSGKDYLRIDGTEKISDERVRIEMQWDEMPATNSALVELFKNLKKAAVDVLSNRASVKEETKRESLLSKISDNINESLPGTTDPLVVKALEARMFDPPA